MCNGYIALLPAPPMKMKVNAHAMTEQPMKVAPPAVLMALWAVSRLPDIVGPKTSLSKSKVLV